MTELNIPDPAKLVDAKVRKAHRYTQMGWKVFVLGRDKTPLPNCSDCHNADWTHRRESCRCLTCHGFYAATDVLHDIMEMVERHPDGWLAVRTGAASRLLVLDFEAAPNEQGVTGLDTLDQWEMWTGGKELPETLRQRTQSGGLHLLYRLPDGVVVKSRNRILPQCDLKAEGGYVAVPTPGREERTWIPRTDHTIYGRAEPLRTAPGSLLDSLEQLRGRSRGGQGREHDALYGGRTPRDGYDYQVALRDGCPGGMRDEFFNDLLFRTRKAGVSYEGAEKIARMHWERCAQPPLTEWYMPWEHVEYKLNRIWQTVEPPKLHGWSPVEDNIIGQTEQGETIVKQGNTAIVRSEW